MSKIIKTLVREWWPGNGNFGWGAMFGDFVAVLLVLAIGVTVVAGVSGMGYCPALTPTVSRAP